MVRGYPYIRLPLRCLGAIFWPLLRGDGDPGLIPRGIRGIVEILTHVVGIPLYWALASQLEGQFLATALEGGQPVLNPAWDLRHGGDPHTSISSLSSVCACA